MYNKFVVQDHFLSYYFVCKLIIHQKVLYDIFLCKSCKVVENKINRYIHNTPLAVEERIQTSNEAKNNLYRNHRVTTHSDADKMDAYNALRSDIQANAGIPLPTREEFEKRLSLNAAACPEEAGGEGKTKKQPIRAYDYIMSDAEIRLDPMLTMGVYVRIILKVLEEELDLKVDYNMIDQCLLCREEFYEYCRHKGYERNDDWDFPMEYDEKLEMTKEEYEELKERYAEYLFYKKKLNELKPLYQYKKSLLRNPVRQKTVCRAVCATDHFRCKERTDIT